MHKDALTHTEKRRRRDAAVSDGLVEMKGISTPASKEDTDAQNLSTDPKESGGQATPDTAFDTSAERQVIVGWAEAYNLLDCWHQYKKTIFAPGEEIGLCRFTGNAEACWLFADGGRFYLQLIENEEFFCHGPYESFLLAVARAEDFARNNGGWLNALAKARGEGA